MLRELIGRLPGPWGLRCRSGDLAMMVKSWSENEGRVVICVRLAKRHEWDGAYGGPRWVVDGLFQIGFAAAVLELSRTIF